MQNANYKILIDRNVFIGWSGEQPPSAADVQPGGARSDATRPPQAGGQQEVQGAEPRPRGGPQHRRRPLAAADERHSQPFGRRAGGDARVDAAPSAPSGAGQPPAQLRPVAALHRAAAGQVPLVLGHEQHPERAKPAGRIAGSPQRSASAGQISPQSQQPPHLAADRRRAAAQQTQVLEHREHGHQQQQHV